MRPLTIADAIRAHGGQTQAARDALLNPDSGGECGTATLDSLALPVSTIDFTAAGIGTVRRGVYDVESDVLRLDFSSPLRTAPFVTRRGIRVPDTSLTTGRRKSPPRLLEGVS